jgi:hypothetical protein
MIITSLFPYNHIIYKIKNKHHNLKDQKALHMLTLMWRIRNGQQ